MLKVACNYLIKDVSSLMLSFSCKKLQEKQNVLDFNAKVTYLI